MHNSLQELYDATEEDLLYGVGVLAMPTGPPAPFIEIHYRGWPREKLEVVRESFRAGLTLVVNRDGAGASDRHLSTRELVSVEARQDGHTSVLRAPAWSAHLAQVGANALEHFETGRGRFGGFLLSLETPQWEFIAAVDDTRECVRVGPVFDSTASNKSVE